MNTDRLAKQIDFLIEVEKLKTIYRQNMVHDRSRHENSAEHSWHLVLMALILTDTTADPSVDKAVVMEMLLIHDIVEIDAGDTFLYDETGYATKEDRETRAAQRIFGLLPDDQKERALALWQEFDERKTPNALFAAALDNMQPVINHYINGGSAIRHHALTRTQIIEKKQFIQQASPALWDITLAYINKSAEAGFYTAD